MAKSTDTTAEAKLSSVEKLSLLRSMADLFEIVSRAGDVAVNEGWQAEAKLLRHWQALLEGELDKLRGAVLKDWIGNAKAIVASIEQSTQRIKKSIDDLKDEAKNAQTAIKIAGYVDDAIKIAAKFLV